MDLEQKLIMNRRNFSKVVIAGLSSLSLPLFSLAEGKKNYKICVYTTDGNNDSVNKRIAQLRKHSQDLSELNPDNFRIEKLETKVNPFYTNPDEITIIDNLTGKIKNLVIGLKEPKKTAVYLEDGKPHEKSIESYVSISSRNIVVGSTEKDNSPDVGFIFGEEFYRVQSRNGGYVVVDENKNDDPPIKTIEGDCTIHEERKGMISMLKFDGLEFRIEMLVP